MSKLSSTTFKLFHFLLLKYFWRIPKKFLGRNIKFRFQKYFFLKKLSMIKHPCTRNASFISFKGSSMALVEDERQLKLREITFHIVSPKFSKSFKLNNMRESCRQPKSSKFLCTRFICAAFIIYDAIKFT